MPSGNISVPAKWQEFYDSLPDAVPLDEIIAANARHDDIHITRRYRYNGWEFELPPGVHMPGGSSRIILDRLLDGNISVANRSYAAVGSGLGVEAVIAGARGASEIYAIDVHPASVQATSDHYKRIIGLRKGTIFHPIVSDLFERFPESKKIDVITFNPPAVHVKISDDPDIIRILCVGTPVVARFFQQIAEGDLLSAGGEIFLLVSNTADLKKIIEYALRWEFIPEVTYLRVRILRTYLFRFQRG